MRILQEERRTSRPDPVQAATQRGAEEGRTRWLCPAVGHQTIRPARNLTKIETADWAPARALCAALEAMSALPVMACAEEKAEGPAAEERGTKLALSWAMVRAAARA